MDALLRGSIERHLDSLLTKEDALVNAANMFKESLSPTVRNLEDALVGYITGRIIQFSFLAMQTYYGRDPGIEEYGELAGILKRRAMEIKTKVTLVTNR